MARSPAGKTTRRQSTKFVDPQKFNEIPEIEFDTPTKPKIDKSPIVPQTPGQRKYLSAIQKFQITFATGPAGTGKSFMATSYAAMELDAKKIDKIVIARPAVEAGEKMGFLPGAIEDKFGPYLVPYLETFHLRLGKSFTEFLIKTGRIEAVPFAYMRGRTFNNCIMLLDEAQNATPDQVKLFLTRIGEDSQVIVNGDLGQPDINGLSGLEDAIARLSFLPFIKHVHMTTDDIVRSAACREIVEAYENSTLDICVRRL